MTCCERRVIVGCLLIVPALGDLPIASNHLQSIICGNNTIQDKAKQVIGWKNRAWANSIPRDFLSAFWVLWLEALKYQLEVGKVCQHEILIPSTLTRTSRNQVKLQIGEETWNSKSKTSSSNHNTFQKQKKQKKPLVSTHNTSSQRPGNAVEKRYVLGCQFPSLHREIQFEPSVQYNPTIIPPSTSNTRQQDHLSVNFLFHLK